MRFIITSTTAPDSKTAEVPSDALFAAYMKFNEDLLDAGVLVAAEGLTPGTPGARIVAQGDKRIVVDGPFAETKELVGGFYIIEVPTLEEAKAWALRCPVGMASADVLEVRQLTAMEDIPPRYLDLAASVAPKWTASVTKRAKKR
jgi:hypothetical protein